MKVPLKNGFDVLRELRDTQKNMPAIFITSLASIDDLAMGYDAGCDDYIKKPFHLKELNLRINKILENLTKDMYHKRLSKNYSFYPKPKH